MDTKKAILKYVFEYPDSKLSLQIPWKNCMLEELMGTNEGKMIVDMDVVDVVTALVNRVVEETGGGMNEGMPPLPSLPPLEQETESSKNKEAGKANEDPVVLGVLRQGMARKDKNEIAFEPA